MPRMKPCPDPGTDTGSRVCIRLPLNPSELEPGRGDAATEKATRHQSPVSLAAAFKVAVTFNIIRTLAGRESVKGSS